MKVLRFNQCPLPVIIWSMSASTNVRFNQCPLRPMSASTNVCFDQCLLWPMSTLTHVCLNLCLFGPMSAFANVLLTKKSSTPSVFCYFSSEKWKSEVRETFRFLLLVQCNKKDGGIKTSCLNIKILILQGNIIDSKSLSLHFKHEFCVLLLFKWKVRVISERDLPISISSPMQQRGWENQIQFSEFQNPNFASSCNSL